MKKYFLYLLILPILWACGSDNALSIVENETHVKMNSTETHLIEISSLGEVSFSSENDYIATVDQKGIVTASKVGQTFIKVLSNGKSQKIKITVEPQYSLYETPILKFGITYKTLSQEIELKKSDNSDVFLYKSSSQNTSLYRYRFRLGVLRSVDLNIKASRANEVDAFLTERYTSVSNNSNSYSQTYINAPELSKATVMITSNLETNTGEVNVVYTSVGK